MAAVMCSSQGPLLIRCHATEAAALSEIIYAEDAGKPSSPVMLAKKLGLSKPALSACINRLEAAGHVQRSKEFAERRVVSLRCSPEIYRHAETFFCRCL